MIRVCVPGAAGRMGQMVLEALREREGEAVLSACTERPGHPQIGEEVHAGVRLGDDLVRALDDADVYIDFTAPEATALAVAAAAEKGVAAVIGTTGLAGAHRAAIDAAAKKIPVVLAPNFSLGVNLTLGLVEQAARSLGARWDAEIVELHHRMKRDAPSGTAIALAESVARGHGVALDEVKRYRREGDVGARPDGEVGVFAVRGGDVVGEHTVFFFGSGERIEITHRATSRMIFARGAVSAALWVVGKKPGLYGMKDVLGLGA